MIFLMISLSNLKLSFMPYAFCLLKRIMRMLKNIHAKNSHLIYFQISFFFLLSIFFFIFFAASEIRCHSLLPHWCLEGSNFTPYFYSFSRGQKTNDLKVAGALKILGASQNKIRISMLSCKYQTYVCFSVNFFSSIHTTDSGPVWIQCPPTFPM